MRVLLAGAGIALAAAAMWACGPTIGDACTSAADCGKGTCLQGNGSPGGYCTRGCPDGGWCPNGTTCVAGAGPAGLNICLLRCDTARDCRSGYDCLTPDGGSTPVCVGAP